MIGMMDHNEDDLNQFNRKGLPDVLNAALRGDQPGISRRRPADRGHRGADGRPSTPWASCCKC